MPERAPGGGPRVLPLALRSLRRDARSPQFLIIALALTVAVAAITAVGTFTERVRSALAEQAGTLLAADLALISSEPLPARYRTAAARLGLATSELLGMRSMVSAGEGLQLVEIKAAGPGYPLRGRLEVASARFGPVTVARDIPARGTVWGDDRLLQMLDAAVGDRLQIGAATFELARLVVLEPDRGGDLFNIAPRVLMNLADVPATGLVLPGSRVQYTLLVAGERAPLRRFRDELPASEDVRLVAPDSARPEIRTAITHAEQFLGLAALVAVLLSGVAVLVAARSFAREHEDSVALLRTLGATRAFIGRLFALEALLLGAGAALLGVGAGYALHALLAALLGDWMQTALPPPSALPALRGMASGILALLGFALPPLLALRDVPPVRVLRRATDAHGPASLVVVAYAGTALMLLVPWRAGDWRMTLWTLAGLAASLALLTLCALAALRLLDLLRRRARASWRSGLANLGRRRGQSLLQIVSLGLGLMALLLLGLVRTDLLARWQERLPPGAPDQFLINIQPDQVGAMRAFLAGHGIADPALYPMVRGRLVAIAGVPVEPDAYEDPRASRLADREFNLSSATALKSDNRIVAGAWWETADAPAQFSVERDIAAILGIALGDTLSYRVADREITAPVTSLREVSWDTMQANFFVVSPPTLLADLPATYITSFKLPAGDAALLRALVHEFPSVTVLDVAALIAQIRGIMARAVSAVEFVFLFTLVSGIVVLVAAVQSTQRERVYDSTLMKTLGATRVLIARMIAAEFLFIGAIAGVVGGAGALLGAWLVARYVLHIDYGVTPLVLVIGIAGGIAGVVIAGLYAVIDALREPVLGVLRRVG